MNEVFFSIVAKASYGPFFFFPKPVRLGFKKQTPNPKQYSKSAAAGVARLLGQV